MTEAKFALQRRICHIIALLTLLIVALLALGKAALAQTENSTGVRGEIYNSAREKIVGAQISISNQKLGVRRETVSDGEGQFAVLGLPPGEGYILSASADGFETQRKAEITLVSGALANINFSLELKSVAETITVNDAAQFIINNAPEVSQTVDARRLAELPSNGRSLNRFALLDPHVRNTGGLGGDGSNATRLSINANSFRVTYYKLDGNSNYDFVYGNAPQQQISIAAVQEFKVFTNQYSAEYGNSTAGIISAVTKSGTSDFHGEAFYYLRPSGIQAAPPVSTLHTPNELQQFGGAFGGSLLGEKSQRATFFLNYEATRRNRGAFIQSPAPAIFIGHFRDQLALARFDFQLNEAHTVTARFNFNRNANDNANDRVSAFTQANAAQRSVQQGAGGQITDRTIWGSIVNELRLSYVNALPSYTQALQPQVAVVRPNYSTTGGSNYSWTRTQSLQIADQIAFQSGAHEIKLGGDFARQKVREFNRTQFGTYTFANGAPPDSTLPLTYSQTFGDGAVRYGQTLLSAFAQDNWRALARLTLNLGMRYEYQSVTHDTNNFAPRLGFAYDLKGDGKTIIRGGAGIFYDQYYLYIYRRFILEGMTAALNTYTFNYAQNANQKTTPGAPAFPNVLSAPPVGLSAVRDYVYLPASTLLNPYSEQFSLGIQRALFNNWTLTVDAIHQRTLKLQRVNDINAPAPFIRTAPGQTRTVAAADATRPFGVSYNGIAVKKVAVIENSSSSNYDALDVGLLKRFAHRYQFEAHYVYSSALNYSMFFGEANTGIPDQFRVDARLDRAPSDFHQRHRFVANGLIELPFKMQFSSVVTLASGLPVNPVTGVDNNGDGYTTDRPVGLARNSFRTPPQESVDVSLAKRFALRERAHLELRAETFNLLNHTNYIKLNGTYGNGAQPAATFLTPIAGVANVDPARQFQFAARLIF
jgi:hypothetical protein